MKRIMNHYHKYLYTVNIYIYIFKSTCMRHQTMLWSLGLCLPLPPRCVEAGVDGKNAIGIHEFKIETFQRQHRRSETYPINEDFNGFWQQFPCAPMGLVYLSTTTYSHLPEKNCGKCMGGAGVRTFDFPNQKTHSFAGCRSDSKGLKSLRSKKQWLKWPCMSSPCRTTWIKWSRCTTFSAQPRFSRKPGERPSQWVKGWARELKVYMAQKKS